MGGGVHVREGLTGCGFLELPVDEHPRLGFDRSHCTPSEVSIRLSRRPVTPCWHGISSGYRYPRIVRIAALDLGTNSFHLLVADVQPDGHFEPIAAEKAMIRLGDVVSREGSRVLRRGSIRSRVRRVRR